MEGNNYWPTWGSSQPGALMAYFSGWLHASHERFAYRYPYFYGVLDYNVDFGYPTVFYGQALDSLGNRMMGENGVWMCTIDDGNYQYTNCVPDGNNGLVLVYTRTPSTYYDIWAKRASFDGSLGGPSPITVSLTPYNPPIMIPANGGTFDFNIALENLSQSPVANDVWTMATLPNGNEYGPIIGPVNLTLNPGFLDNRDRMQNVPANAPAGNYTYDAHVGSYPDVIIEEARFDF